MLPSTRTFAVTAALAFGLLALVGCGGMAAIGALPVEAQEAPIAVYLRVLAGCAAVLVACLGALLVRGFGTAQARVIDARSPGAGPAPVRRWCAFAASRRGQDLLILGLWGVWGAGALIIALLEP